VESTEKIIQKFDNDKKVFDPGALEFEIKGLEPTVDRIVHIDKIGINGFIEVQLSFPERTLRGMVKGSQRIDFRVGCHQNPHKFIFFVPHNVEVFLDINNPKLFAIKSEVHFKGWIYEIKDLKKERPRDEITKEPLPFKDITNYTPHRG
jgi:hypothetical protein